jgi:hypothetical protein
VKNLAHIVPVETQHLVGKSLGLNKGKLTDNQHTRILMCFFEDGKKESIYNINQVFWDEKDD